MTFNRVLVTALLWSYPRAWRREYGPELEDVLLARPLSVRLVFNVLGSGLFQHMRAWNDASTIAGLVPMAFVLIRLTSEGGGITAVVTPSGITLPAVVVKLMKSELYASLLIGWGCAVRVRDPEGTSRSGKAAVKIALVTGIPVMLTGILMLSGLVKENALNPWAVLTAPLFFLPQAWTYGAIGGAVGPRLVRRLRPSGWSPLRRSTAQP
jgi:hypothetical protein